MEHDSQSWDCGQYWRVALLDIRILLVLLAKHD